MKLSCLLLTLAIIFVLTIVHAPNVKAKALADPESDAVGFADAVGEADPFDITKLNIKKLTKATCKVISKGASMCKVLFDKKKQE
uniref:M-myrmeciitoxin-Mb2a n=1 Tax=Myrmecia banksi TaxID=36171 RepID=TX2A_MYRBA|nr:RecName: Full=M-myrmeciitoxin-Mb2a; Short=M-MIITX-Mb2a; AltName: Full=M-myrmeciitoxin-Mp3a; Short=M-MIITX-Mp3a; AltName: Full=Pilosulin-4; Flags: Precursor [Myrmecia banksi]BAD36780.1 pilosulin 4 [Myrmecia banksi]